MTAALAVALLTVMSVVVAGCGESRAPCARQIGPEELRGEWDDEICKWREDLPARAVPGARVFANSGCLTCHTYRKAGAANLGARDLTDVGLRHGRRFFERFVADPTAYGNDVMPKFEGLGRRRLRQLAIFLVASRGGG